MNDDVQFIDAEEYMGQSKGTTFREIALKHFTAITNLATKEFKEGYWQKKPIATSGGVYLAEIYVEDTREAYINAVNCLHDILLPHFDDKMKEVIIDIEMDYERRLKEFKESNKSPTEWVDEKLEIKRKLFQQLSLLLFRLGYLEGKFIADG